MQYKKITITLPQYIYEILIENVPKGQRSEMIARSIEQTLIHQKTDQDILSEISTLREETVPYRKDISIDSAKKKGRA